MSQRGTDATKPVVLAEPIPRCWKCAHGHVHADEEGARVCSAHCFCGQYMINEKWCYGGHYGHFAEEHARQFDDRSAG